MLVDRNVQRLSRQFTKSIRAHPKPNHRLQFFLFALCLLVGVQQLNPIRLTGVVQAALPTCLNTVSSGVYLDDNENGVREQNELFLAGRILVVDQSNSLITSLEAANGLFTLQDITCGEYTIYHNGDYVGKLRIEEVMGQALIELPKTKLLQHTFIPIIVN